jgi:hypothetical protein
MKNNVILARKSKRDGQNSLKSYKGRAHTIAPNADFIYLKHSSIKENKKCIIYNKTSISLVANPFAYITLPMKEQQYVA